MAGLLTVDDALKRILSSVPVIEREICQLGLLDGLGRTLANDIFSPINVPLYDNSAMDGYAVRSADSTSGPMPVSQRIAAGSVVGHELEPGTVARIFTGAEIPPGADAVVMQENCELVGDSVKLNGVISPGLNVRPCGQDIRADQLVFTRGRALSPQDIGLLASIGVDRIGVFSPVKVAIISTGNELVEPGDGPLRSGQLYNSNRYTLAALLRQMHIEVVDLGIIPDDPEETALALNKAAAMADCVITTGGVSVGEEDHIKEQVAKLGQLKLWKLAIKPGKPLAYGRVGATPFFGLPGNPASVFVTFSILVRPFLLALQGRDDPAPLRIRASADFTRSKPGSRQEYLRVTIRNADSGLVASVFSNQSSGVLSSITSSNGLAVVPAGVIIAPGDEVDVLLLKELGT